MANPEHLKILDQGVEVWNKWRRENLYQWIDLRETDLSDIDLSEADFQEADLSKTNLSGANLINADFFGAYLPEANLSYANLFGANLFDAKLFDADLTGADFSWADLSYANLSETDLSEANLSNVRLIGTRLSNSVLKNTRIYGISAWDIKKDGLIQKDLIITPEDEPEITVDDLEVAQFIYLMLNNQKIRDVIETITSKAVLILGRFTEERKKVLDALKDELRRRNYLPIVFDFENVGGKSVDETVNLLARMSRFVVADITDAKSIPQELKGFVEANAIPVIPLILKGQSEYGMFDHFKKYHWMLPLHEYDSPEILLDNIIPAIIAPAEQKVAELRGK